MKSFYCNVVVLLVVSFSSCLCRPQTTIDSQDVPLSTELDTPSVPLGLPNAWRKLVGYEPAIQRFQSLMEDGKQQPPIITPLERLQMEFLTRFAQQQNAIGGIGSSLLWDPMYRMPEMKMPEMKRQVRYRQCYFNPISCFRK